MSQLGTPQTLNIESNTNKEGITHNSVDPLSRQMSDQKISSPSTNQDASSLSSDRSSFSSSSPMSISPLSSQLLTPSTSPSIHIVNVPTLVPSTSATTSSDAPSTRDTNTNADVNTRTFTYPHTNSPPEIPSPTSSSSSPGSRPGLGIGSSSAIIPSSVQTASTTNLLEAQHPQDPHSSYVSSPITSDSERQIEIHSSPHDFDIRKPVPNHVNAHSMSDISSSSNTNSTDTNNLHNNPNHHNQTRANDVNGNANYEDSDCWGKLLAIPAPLHPPEFTEKELNFTSRPHIWSLRFPSLRLENYFVSTRRLNRCLMRLVVALLLFGNGLAGLSDQIVYSQADIPSVYIVRYAAITPLCIALLWMTYYDSYETHRKVIEAVYAFVFGALLLIISYIGGNPNFGIYIAYFYAVQLFLGLHFFIGALVCWVLFFGFIGISIAKKVDISAIVYLGLTNIMLLIVSYNTEDSMRGAFLQNERLRHEQKKSDLVLYNILPKRIAQELVKGQRSADYYKCASVLFCDIYDFKAISADLPARVLVGLMNNIFSRFDHITDHHEVLKIETIGEVYMVAAGVVDESKWHQESLCYLAIEMRAASADFFIDHENLRERKRIYLRIGIHSGDIIAGVIGVKLPRYRLFGDTVNTASRMQSTCIQNKIQISEQVQKEVKDSFRLTHRGQIWCKGKGHLSTWFLEEASKPQDPSHNKRMNVPRKATASDHLFNFIKEGKSESRLDMKLDDLNGPIVMNPNYPSGRPNSGNSGSGSGSGYPPMEDQDQMKGNEAKGHSYSHSHSHTSSIDDKKMLRTRKSIRGIRLPIRTNSISKARTNVGIQQSPNSSGTNSNPPTPNNIADGNSPSKRASVPRTVPPTISTTVSETGTNTTRMAIITTFDDKKEGMVRDEPSPRNVTVFVNNVN